MCAILISKQYGGQMSVSTSVHFITKNGIFLVRVERDPGAALKKATKEIITPAWNPVSIVHPLCCLLTILFQTVTQKSSNITSNAVQNDWHTSTCIEPSYNRDRWQSDVTSRTCYDCTRALTAWVNTRTRWLLTWVTCWVVTAAG